jgi:hypothetical protein
MGLYKAFALHLIKTIIKTEFAALLLVKSYASGASVG